MAITKSKQEWRIGIRCESRIPPIANCERPGRAGTVYALLTPILVAITLIAFGGSGLGINLKNYFAKAKGRRIQE